MRKLFEALSIFDWITPAIAILEDVAEGGPVNLDVWTFYVPYDQAIRKGWSAAYIRGLLAQHGVKTWGHLNHFGEHFFKVNLEYILNRYGVPIAAKSQGAPRLKRKAQRMPAWRHVFEKFK